MIIELTLGRAPASASTVTTTYGPLAGGSSLTDVSGNPVAAFSNSIVTSYRTSSSVLNLASSYRLLELLGSDPVTGIGNAAANTIIGNPAANIIDGGAGSDVLTGLGGRDTFRFSLLTDSVLTGYDRITDLEIGFDRIDGPSPVASSAIRQLGAVSALTSTALQLLLQPGVFAANGAATFGFGNRTFLALNDSTAGFNSARDALIEITGYSGSLGVLEII
ncbi:MAG: hypothetical protein EBR26_06970 [Microbacteriaceae bacterium]|nr:hypothetical protein [Microbacteriaceae bacterium]